MRVNIRYYELDVERESSAVRPQTRRVQLANDNTTRRRRMRHLIGAAHNRTLETPRFAQRRRARCPKLSSNRRRTPRAAQLASSAGLWRAARVW